MTNVSTETGQSSGTTEQVKEQVQGAAQQVGEKAQQARGQARERVRTQIDSRSTAVGEQIRDASDAIRRSSSDLREQGKEGPAGVMEQVADRGERLASYFHDADGDRILGDVERFARSRPWLVAAGSAVVGFVASRFMKASSGRRYEREGGYGGEMGAPAGALLPAGTGTLGSPPLPGEAAGMYGTEAPGAVLVDEPEAGVTSAPRSPGLRGGDPGDIAP